MKRRTALLGLASVATGSVAALGTGAFSSVEADREVSVDVQTDTEAYLGLEPVDSDGNSVENATDGGRSPVAHEDDPFAIIDEDTGRLNLNFLALNANARTVVPSVFKISNLARGEVDVHIEKSFEGEGSGNPEAISFFRNSDDLESGTPLDDESNNVTIPEGESIVVDIVVETFGLDPGDNIIDQMTIVATNTDRGDSQ